MRASLRISLLPALLALVTAPFFQACSGDDGSGGNLASDGATYTQVDRMGIPALNTVFNEPKNVQGFSKLLYNQRGPDSDLVNYQAQFISVLGAVANDSAAKTVTLLLPDELPAKLGLPISDFSKLDGRKPSDDAADIALAVTVGSSLANLHTDHVDSNDAKFITDFPFLAPPH